MSVVNKIFVNSRCWKVSLSIIIKSVTRQESLVCAWESSLIPNLLFLELWLTHFLNTMHDFSLQKMVAEHIEREHQSNLSKLCTLQKLRNLNSFKNKFLKILKKWQAIEDFWRWPNFFQIRMVSKSIITGNCRASGIRENGRFLTFWNEKKYQTWIYSKYCTTLNWPKQDFWPEMKVTILLMLFGL